MHPTPIRWRLALATALCLVAAACGDKNEAAASSAPAAPVAAQAPPESVAFAPAPAPGEDDAFNAQVRAALELLGTELGQATTQPYLDTIALGGESPHAALGAISFLGEKLDLATWIYGQGVLAEPANADYLNNFGVGLHEKAITLSRTDPQRPLLDLAIASLEKAAALQPGNAAFHSNLGFARLEAWRTQGDAKPLLQSAVDALRKAVELDARSATAWAHLAEALSAQFDIAGSIEALNKARAIAPYNGALLATYNRLVPVVLDELKKSATGCAAIDYECKAQCPRSIIGQVNFVTCEVAQSAAQGACESGRPYAADFDCSEQLPQFGILFPGLNSGFSLITPYGRLDLTVDGRGFVQYKFKPSTSVIGPVGVSMTVKGNMDPVSGWAEIRFKAGVSVGYKGNTAAEFASDHKMGPVSASVDIDLESGQSKGEIKAYGGTILAN